MEINDFVKSEMDFPKYFLASLADAVGNCGESGGSALNMQFIVFKQLSKEISSFRHLQRRLPDRLKTIVENGESSRMVTHLWSMTRYSSFTVRCQAKNPIKC